ncbi:hypothetical protein N7522_011355 [Penicillium canescens]|nr:hypothetical protein N7522_011355 [Penicillium canescens]
MANNRKRPVILGGSILCCGDLGASSPEKFSNQLLKPPAFLPLVPSYHRKFLIHRPAYRLPLRRAPVIP